MTNLVVLLDHVINATQINADLFVSGVRGCYSIWFGK